MGEPASSDPGRERGTQLEGLRVLVMADLAYEAEALSNLFTTQTAAESRPVGSADDLDGVRRLLEDGRPTVLLWSVRDLTRATAAPVVALREDAPLGVVLIVDRVSRDALTDLLVRGRRSLAVLRRAVDPHFEDIVRGVEDVHAGRSSLDPEIFEALLDAPQSGGLSELTRAEREVAELLAEGLRNCTIAERLVKSERTVEKHVAGVFTKLGLSDETHVDRRVAAARMVLTERQAADDQKGA